MSTEGKFTGVIFALLGEFNVWPAPQEGLIFHEELDEGVIDFFGIPNLAIKVVLTQKNGETSQVETCPIISGPEISLFIFSVTWDFPEIDVHINGHHVASTDTTKVIEENLKWSATENDNKSIIFTDITVDNEQYRTQRIKESCSLQTRADRLPANNEKPYEDLSNALKQLRDQIAAIKRGEMHQDTALAARLRALICRSKSQSPLLQRCAGELKLPLIFYGIPPLLPQYWDPIRDGDLSSPIAFSIKLSASPTKTIATQVAMDLDYWLQMQSANMNEKLYTNDEVVRAFADTEGAHYDNGVEPLVQALKRINHFRAEMTMLHKFFLMTAECVLAIGEYVLQEKLKLTN